jgi:hypothetical protein
MQPKNSTFAERQALAAAAKKALLEKFKPKPMIQAEAPIDHEAERRERVEAIRAQREAERIERQRAREEAEAKAEAERIAAEAAAEQARIDAELSVDALKRAERKARKKEIKEAAKAKKETRSSSSSSGGGPREERALDPFEEHRRYIQSLERGRERRRA